MRAAVASTRRLAGAAGLGYVLGASIENMEILEAPTLDSPVPAIRAFNRAGGNGDPCGERPLGAVR
jgi:hypothetical protein